MMMGWDEKYMPLAVYNSEVARGILHTEEYKKKMNELQDRYRSEVIAHSPIVK